MLFEPEIYLAMHVEAMFLSTSVDVIYGQKTQLHFLATFTSTTISGYDF